MSRLFLQWLKIYCRITRNSDISDLTLLHNRSTTKTDMFHLLITFLTITSTSAYLTNFPDFLYLENFNYDVTDEELQAHAWANDDGEQIWVLDIDSNMLECLKLRRVTQAEKEDFESAIGPMIEGVESQRKEAIVKGRKPIKKNIEHGKRDVEEIMRIVNKFVLSASKVDPSAHLPEDDDEFVSPSLALYFKGRYSALLIKYGLNEWRFFINHPSPLPDWFYINHEGSEQATYIEVPKDVELDFYGAFLRLLKIFLRFDL